MTPDAPAGERPAGGGTDELGDSTALRLRRIVYRARRTGMGWALLLVVLALIAGFLLGRQTGEAPTVAVARQLEQDVLPLVLDADGIWSSAARDEPSVSEAMVALQQDADGGIVTDHGAFWLETYDTLLDRMAAVEVDPLGRPVQRQFVNGVTLMRDAVELLQRAASIEDADRRAALLVEVGRLRMRGEQIVQSARAGIADLDGDGGSVSRLPELPGFDDPGSED
ncbi:MAG TPA: hypothetical protein VK906_02930 [Egicoccus sp.]|nr:hypothetical protein [Egicoccus sp.]HSK22098.1 hypothetical protein [Egicoccus sp.]